jgi:Animal haem peroxidase
MKRHGRDSYYVVGEGILTEDDRAWPLCQRPSTEAELRKFRFSRMGPKGPPSDSALHRTLAEAMVRPGPQPNSVAPAIPAGFTYLGQFVDHDLTFDRTATAAAETVSVRDLAQGRSPALDLDCLYGRGPTDPVDARFYGDAVRLKVGTTAAAPFPDAGTNVDRDGFDLPRVGLGSRRSERRRALIPDLRNDENLVVAQIHLAFIRFHNRVVGTLGREGTPSTELFQTARASVVKHYQWMLKSDFLPRIVDREILDDVFANGRSFFEVVPNPGNPRADASYMTLQPGDMPTMPVEFSVAAFRLGHSMIREAYQWNRVFRSGGPGGVAPLLLLFSFSGTGGTLSPDGDPTLADPDSGSFERLPTSGIVDFRRLFDFGEAGRADLAVRVGTSNVAKRIDTLLVDPLKDLPLGSFGGHGVVAASSRLNLALRNLSRAAMVQLATGQQMASMMEIKPLSAAEIIEGSGGAALAGLTASQRNTLAEHTPLWFYILREAELTGGRLTGVGARIVAEVFHRAMEGSRHSILRDPTWRPRFGPDSETFRMVDLLLFAFEGRADLLNPLGD